MRARDRGSMSLLVVFVAVAITAAVVIALVPVLTGLVARERAQSAADAAALAGVNGGRTASVAVVDANGGELVAWERSGRRVTVSVSVDGVTVTARATDAP